MISFVHKDYQRAAMSEQTVRVNWMLKGIYHCTNCDNIEAVEREVYCWKCGTGEMIWLGGNKIRWSAEIISAARHDDLDPSLQRWWQKPLFDGPIHYTNLLIRANGKDYNIEADFIPKLAKALKLVPRDD